MAKVMVSIPDDLLAQIDRRAKAAGTTRSGWLQEVARGAIADDAEARAARIRAFLAGARPHGGDSARWIREDRGRDAP